MSEATIFIPPHALNTAVLFLVFNRFVILNTELPKLINKLFEFYNKCYEIFIKGEKL